MNELFRLIFEDGVMLPELKIINVYEMFILYDF